MSPASRSWTGSLPQGTPYQSRARGASTSASVPEAEAGPEEWSLYPAGRWWTRSLPQVISGVQRRTSPRRVPPRTALPFLTHARENTGHTAQKPTKNTGSVPSEPMVDEFSSSGQSVRAAPQQLKAQSRNRSAQQKLSVLRDSVCVGVVRHAYLLAQIPRAQTTRSQFGVFSQDRVRAFSAAPVRGACRLQQRAPLMRARLTERIVDSPTLLQRQVPSDILGNSSQSCRVSAAWKNCRKLAA